MKANFLSRHEKGTILEQLLESRVKNRIKEDDSVKIQLLGGRQQVQQMIEEQGFVAPSGNFCNFSEYLDYIKETAIKLQKIVRVSEDTFEAIGRPDLHGVNADYETAKQTLMNNVYDETPAKVEDVEMFDEYAAQGVIDEIPEVEAREIIPRKKRSESKRRRREYVNREVVRPDVETASGRKTRRPKRYTP